MKILSSFLLLLSATPLWADAAAAAGKPAGGLTSFAPLALIMVLFYFLLIRPQQKQAKEQRTMLDALKKGDRVLTQGGFYVTIVAIKGQALEVKLNDDVKALVARSSVTQVVQGDPAVEVPVVVSK